MPATATKLRNLIKISMISIANSDEPTVTFLGGASVASNQRQWRMVSFVFDVSRL